MKEVNLLPPSYQKIEENRFIQKTAFVLLGGVGLVIFSLHGVMKNEVTRTERLLTRPSARLDSPAVNRLNQETAALLNESQIFIEDNKDLAALALRPFNIPAVLGVIGNAAANKVWLTTATIDLAKGTCELSGEAMSTRFVSEYMLAMKTSSYFEAVDLVSMGKGTEEIDFKLTLKLKSGPSLEKSDVNPAR